MPQTLNQLKLMFPFKNDVSLKDCNGCPLRDDLLLNNPKDFADLLSALNRSYDLNYLLHLHLLESPTDLSSLTNDCHYEFYRAWRESPKSLLDYLATLSSEAQSSVNWYLILVLSYYKCGKIALELLLKLYMQKISYRVLLRFFDWGVDGGSLEIIDYLMSIAELKNFIIKSSLDFEDDLCIVDDLYEIVTVAAKNGHVAVVERLLEIPEFFNSVIKNIKPLYLAIRYGHLTVVTLLMEIPGIALQGIEHYDYDPEEDYSSNDYLEMQYSLLQLAAVYGHHKIVEYLLSIPDIVLQAPVPDNCILSYGVSSGNLSVVKCLLDIPAIKARAHFRGNGALGVAADLGFVDIYKILITIPEILAHNLDEALKMAVCGGHMEIANSLMEMPGVINCLPKNNNEVLHTVLAYGDFNMVNRLLLIPEVLSSPINFSLIDENYKWGWRHIEVFNRVLELPKVRFFSLIEPHHKRRAKSEIMIVLNALKRALWLDLEKMSDFGQISSISALRSFIHNFFEKNPKWVQTNLISNQELIESLIIQVLSLRFYGYMNHVALDKNAPNKRLLEHTFSQNWLDCLNKFLPLPKSLSLFIEHKDILAVAVNCLKQWRLDKQSIACETASMQDPIESFLANKRPRIG